ncbi:MAG TPA: hypothetical protein VIG37_26060 [Methylomirabilota bacterium]
MRSADFDSRDSERLFLRYAERARPKCDERELSDQSPTVTFAAAILPPEQPAEPTPNNRRDEPVTVLVALDHSHRFLFTEKSMRRDEMLGADGHFFARARRNVANPVRMWPEAVRHHDLGALLPILDDLQDGLTPQAAVATDMSQQQAPMAKQPTQPPGMEVTRAHGTNTTASHVPANARAPSALGIAREHERTMSPA